MKKYAIKKCFHTILQKTEFSGMRGGTFDVFFSTPRSVREKRFEPSATSAPVLLFHQIPSFYDVCSRNGKRESGTLVSAHQSVRWSMAHPSVPRLVHNRKSMKTAKKFLLTPLLSTTLLKRGPLMETLQF